MIHYYIFNYGNTGSYYWIGIEGIREIIDSYLKSISNHVLFQRTKDKPHRSEKGNRVLPCGIVRCCSFVLDTRDTFSNRKLKGELI